MPAASRSRATAADLVVLAAALKLDEQRSPTEVRARDARIGADLIGQSGDRPALTLAWLDRLEHEDAHLRDRRARVTTALQTCGVVVAVLGLVLGWLAALAAFYYEGSGRVNVIAVLVVLVGVPGLFLVAFLAAALPRRWIAWLPGATAVSTLARALSPGRLARLALRLVPRESRDAILDLQSRAGEHQTLFARVQKWLLLRWSQVFAVAFQCGALSAALALVLFTDLVFGWSTTLASGDPDRDAARLHQVTTAVAAPWGRVAPDAVPSVELIRESRYYRIVDETVSQERASRLGGWWPFLVLGILVYGLMPRLVVLAVASQRLSAAADRGLAMLPGVSAVVRRLEAAHLQTGATQPGGEGGGSEGRESLPDAATRVALNDRAVRAIVNWAEVPVGDDVIRRTIAEAPVLRAGGAATLAADQDAVARVATAVHAASGGDVAILVKAWEPPLLEFIDFAQALRRSLGDGVAILVFPVAPAESGGLDAGAAAQLEVWRRRLSRVGDPWLRVMEPRAEARR